MGIPFDNSIDPTIAPKKFAILKTEAASVFASNGAYVHLKSLYYLIEALYRKCRNQIRNK